MNRFTSITVLLVIILFCNSDSFAVDKLDTEFERNSDYLPYNLKEFLSVELDKVCKPQFRSYQVLKPKINQDTGIVVRGYNSAIYSNNPAIFSSQNYPTPGVEDDPVKLTINDYSICEDLFKLQKAIVGAGYLKDTVWIFKLFPENENSKIEKVFLLTGHDNNGDNVWEPIINVLLCEDYDFDGKNELFIYVNSVRDLHPRELFCIEIETMEIEWSLPVATPLKRSRFYSCKDSLNPLVIFTGNNPMQGGSDQNFKDNLRYLTIVDSKGHITFNEIISEINYNGNIIPDFFNENFFVAHRFEFSDKRKLINDTTNSNFISLITNGGEILKTKEFPVPIYDMWISYYAPLDDMFLFVNLFNSEIQMYDKKLNLVSISDTVINMQLLGKIKHADFEDTLLIFRNGLYECNLSKIAAFPYLINNFEPFVFDSFGNTVSLVVNSHDHSAIFSFKKKSTIELMSIFYQNNQNLILMFISALLASIVIISIYQRKTKSNLIFIRKQKNEIEEVHLKLKKAQQTIINQEKFKQAKDIAGGFAHEIRNALFPARGSLNNLVKLLNSESGEMDKLKNHAQLTDQSIARAIDMTKLISQYTKLESEINHENVSVYEVMNDVIKANIERVNEQKVKVSINGTESSFVKFNKKQLYIVLNNLLLNSLDALTNRTNPAIFITWGEHKDSHILTFKDNGVGIQEENLDRIFDTFFSTKPNKGTGIGLATTKKLIEMYDGKIAVSSEIGESTTFKITFKI